MIGRTITTTVTMIAEVLGVIAAAVVALVLWMLYRNKTASLRKYFPCVPLPRPYWKVRARASPLTLPSQSDRWSLSMQSIFLGHFGLVLSSPPGKPQLDFAKKVLQRGLTPCVVCECVLA